MDGRSGRAVIRVKRLSSPNDKSPHVWGAVTVSTRSSGHVGDMVLP
jgi:hypothetical protein